MLEIARTFGFPCFVKPSALGSSVGVTKVKSAQEMPGALVEAFRHGERALVEPAIDAREIEVSVLGNHRPEASVPGEIVPSNEFYDYAAKYLDGKSELHIPARLTSSQSDQVRALAIRAFTALDCSGLARVDFFLERGTGRWFVNEVNTMPGFTSISMYPKLWEASGLGYRELVTKLVELAVERWQDRRPLPRG
jgi:D-alanine-D-alanine ligase